MSLSFQDRTFFRVLADGTRSTSPFVVPNKQNLVITDVEWAAQGGVNSTAVLTAGRSLVLGISVAPSSAPQSFTQVFSSRRIPIDSNAATAGIAGGSEQLSSGFVIGSGGIICPYASQDTANGGATSYINTIILRGYLSK